MVSDSADTGQYPVYLGVWTNWSRGQVLGLTLTLRRQEANLLVAFTAFFIAFIATRFWRVLCFAFHRLYATATSQNAIYHQRQAILRNSSTPEGGVKQLVQLIWTNRDRSDRFAPLLMAVIALFFIISLLYGSLRADGGLSSQISTAIGTEVLILSLHCGILDRSIPGTSDGSINDFFALVPSKAELIDNAAIYAQQCYSTRTSGNLLGCLDISGPDQPVIYPPDKDGTPPTENQSDSETLEAVTSSTQASEGPDLSTVSSYNDHSSSPIPEHAPQLPFIPETASFTIEPFFQVDEEQSHD
ncbi:hypothetical protein F5Y01DRAFT_315224 [Xylaria sp. FL0043]|nr:hypothetical protein F5Y01DRAFT_315224 [Xylaria sp. FL0043]